MLIRVLIFVSACLAAASPSIAQPKERIGRYVVDVRGASTGLPTAEGWIPLLPAGTEAPGRSLGLEAGAHVYPWRFRAGALGIGATWLFARGKTAPPEVVETTTSPLLAIPEVTTRVSSFAPQISLNFGHSLGYSYLSAGLGQAKVESEAVFSSSIVVLEPRNSGWVKTLNYGGGARWFITDRVGVGFDLRWHKLSIIAASDDHPGAPRASIMTVGVGVVLR